jgi:hypothetical protein
MRTSIASLLAAAQFTHFAFAVNSVDIDLSQFEHDSPVRVTTSPGELTVVWPIEPDEWGRLTLALENGRSLIRHVALSNDPDEHGASLLINVDPVTVLTVGQRDLTTRNGWVIFFDKVHERSHESYLATLEISGVSVSTRGLRTTVSIRELTAGPFRGRLEFSMYRGSRLIQVEAVLSTEQNGVALVYDAGLSAGSPNWQRVAWTDTEGRLQHETMNSYESARPIAVRHRTIVAESDSGSVAVFPTPHQYFYPLDFSDNLEFVWYGKGFRDLVSQPGLGIRQRLEGDRRFVPWFNAPPGTEQRLGIFYLLSRGRAEHAMDEVKRYTRGDRFKRLPGYLTFSSHYHVEHITDLVNRQGPGYSGHPEDIRIPADLETPGFVQVFKNMGVDIVHLAEFHFGRTPGLSAADRLPLLETMHRECERLSNDGFLLLPGEEPNVHFGGHWISLFPKPVYWVLNRDGEMPFVRQDPNYGTVYHVGSSRDVLNLLEQEGGLAWTAHPRIKSSTGFPDRYRHEGFYASDRFLGAAWKAMPADLSEPRLGQRVLYLLDDMSNWGPRKYALGEVDVFKVNPDHEQYGHMNVNYVQLGSLPRFTDGWQPVLDALRGGKLFVTTGEVLLPKFTVGGKGSGETVELSADESPEIEITVEWTFPLNFAEVISGDGIRVYRHRIELSDTEPFGSRTLRVRHPLKERRWVRVEVWDIAANGAFSQPVWLDD